MRRSFPLLTLGLLAALSLPAQDLAELRAPTAYVPWAYARSVFRTYSNNSRAKPLAAGFSQIMVENVERGYPGRQAAGGWAGEFVRDSFLVAAHDIATDPRFGQAPVTQQALESAHPAGPQRGRCAWFPKERTGRCESLVRGSPKSAQAASARHQRAKNSPLLPGRSESVVRGSPKSAQAAASPLCAVPQRAHRPQRVRCARFPKATTGAPEVSPPASPSGCATPRSGQ
jgi:hypothetical protein